MSTKGKISDLYDIANIEAQHKTVTGYVEELIAKINEIKPVELKLGESTKTKDIISGIDQMNAKQRDLTRTVANLDNANRQAGTSAKAFADTLKITDGQINSLTGTLEQNIRQQVQYKIRAEEIKNELKLLGREHNELEKRSNSYKNKVAELAQEQAELKQATLDVNTVIRQQIREQQAAEGSIEGMTARLDKLQKAYSQLSSEEAGSDVGQALKAEIDGLDIAVKGLQGSIGKYQRNVGNYSAANKILEADLKAVRKAIEDQSKAENKNADVIEQLIRQEKLLSEVVESQAAGFATSVSQYRQTAEALIQMEQAGLDTTEAFRTLFAENAKLGDSITDLKAALKNAAPDDIAFNAAADAARGLIGVYGLAQSATAIFGAENEAFQETLVKLQAAETALQSIEAVRALFKKENAVLQAREMVMNRILIVQKNLETAAESKNIVVKYAAIAAQKAMNLAMSMAGGPIIALLALLALLLLSLASYAASASSVVKSNKQMADSYLDYADTIEQTQKMIDRMDQKRLATMREGFATAKEMREQETADMISEYKLREKAARDFESKFGGTVNIERMIKRQQIVVDDDEDDEEAKKTLDELTKARDQYVKDFEFLADQETAIRVKQADNRRADYEENIKQQQQEIEIYRTGLQTKSKLFEDIAANEERSYSSRITATRQFNKIQEQLINEEARKQRLTPGQTPTELRAIEATRRAAIIEVRRNTAKQVAQFEKEQEERERKAYLDMAKTRLEDTIKAQDAIADNETKGYGERLDAAYRAFEARRGIARVEYEEAIKNKKLTHEELLALETKYASDLNGLMTDYLSKQFELQKFNQEEFTRFMEAESQKRSDIISRESDGAISALNNQFRDRFISITKYNTERERLEKEANQRMLQEEVNLATARVLVTKAGTKERIAAEAELARKAKEFGDAVLETDKDIAAKTVEVWKQAAAQAFQAFENAILGAYTRRANAIQDEIDLLEKKKQKDIEVANATIQNEQDRAAAMIVIEARANAQREQLEIKQRRNEYERAKTERALTIGKIIAETALAVIKVLAAYPGPAGYGLAAATGALGAAQLAAVLATPLPKFKHGVTESKYEGLAIVGDGGKSEMHVRKDGSISITDDKPQLTWVDRGDTIYPDAQKVLDDMRLATSGAYDRRINARAQVASTYDPRIAGKLDKLTETVKNKKELHLQAGFNSLMGIHKLGNHWQEYTRDQTDF